MKRMGMTTGPSTIMTTANMGIITMAPKRMNLRTNTPAITGIRTMTRARMVTNMDTITIISTATLMLIVAPNTATRTSMAAMNTITDTTIRTHTATRPISTIPRMPRNSTGVRA